MSDFKEKSIFIKPELSVEELSLALFRANQNLSETNKQLQESERLRLELFSNLSHDLRSPISTLRSYVEYLLSFDTLDEKEVTTTLGQMHAKVLTLDHLMNELLLISTLDSNIDGSLNYEGIQIGIYLEDFFYSCQVDKKYSQRELELKVPSNFPYYVSIDPKMFLRVLDNLFTNALKYSSPGAFISLNAEYQNNEIIISVADSGTGIEAAYLDKIFERTFMVSKARTSSNTSGCGLGLSIASSIIKKHKGRIWCESTVGKGSTFYLALPRSEPINLV